jgi:hypothetical protein
MRLFEAYKVLHARHFRDMADDQYRYLVIIVKLMGYVRAGR